jgi:V/A-type H+/Na+-transporting ATPase subunit G/H
LKEVVRHLTTEIIKEIKETERAAEEKLKTAQQEAKDLLLRAEEEAARVIKAAEDQELLKGRQQLEAAEKEAYQEADSRKMQNNEKCQELKRKAAEKMEDAVNLVMERIVRINGNS